MLHPRRFQLQRHLDISGVSGVGVVAHGIQWADGAVTIRWLGPSPSTVIWESVDAAMRVHGHGGATELLWVDPVAFEMEVTVRGY